VGGNRPFRHGAGGHAIGSVKVEVSRQSGVKVEWRSSEGLSSWQSSEGLFIFVLFLLHNRILDNGKQRSNPAQSTRHLVQIEGVEFGSGCGNSDFLEIEGR